MAVLEVESLLQPVSPEQPCGPDLQYDEEFVALESASQGKSEQQYGETIIPAESPNWKEMVRVGRALLTRTKDLRVGCHVIRALATAEGLSEFCRGLALIRGYVEQHWEGVHPLLDSDDDNDPTERVNVIASLADQQATVSLLMQAPIVRSPVLGAFSMRDVQVANGEAPALGDESPPDTAAIGAAFMDCLLDELRETTAAVGQGHEDVVAIEAVVTQKVGASNAASLDGLTDSLNMIREYLQGQLDSREAQQEGAEASAAGADAGGASGGPSISGQIRSRDDVVRTLDKICDYYDRHEPSSPVPLLLRRAKRLVTKSFMGILEDLTPEGVSQARVIGGVEHLSGDD